MKNVKQLKKENTVIVMNKLMEVYSELELPATEKSLRKNKKLVKKIAKSLTKEKLKLAKQDIKAQLKKATDNNGHLNSEDGKKVSSDNRNTVVEKKAENMELVTEAQDKKKTKKPIKSRKPASNRKKTIVKPK